jgi:hypothetical protein
MKNQKKEEFIVNKKLILHFDINKTILFSDSA